MSTQTLRELAKDYARGTIGKDTYRKSRTALIQDIITGNIAIKVIDYEPPLSPTNELEEAITEGFKRDKTEVTSPKQAPKPKSVPPVKQKLIIKEDRKKSPLVFILTSVIIVLSLIFAVIFFYPKPPESTAVKISNISENSKIPGKTAITTNKSMVGESLIADFLSEKSWNEDSLDSFITSWSNLTLEERDTAKQTKRMQRMNDSIYKQFLEAKALASIDSEKAVAKQQKLAEFATAIGINDSRLTLDK
jgi:hypothetical protein